VLQKRFKITYFRKRNQPKKNSIHKINQIESIAHIHPDRQDASSHVPVVGGVGARFVKKREVGEEHADVRYRRRLQRRLSKKCFQLSHTHTHTHTQETNTAQCCLPDCDRYLDRSSRLSESALTIARRSGVKFLSGDTSVEMRSNDFSYRAR
jgi:hypothetical protein